jgi:AraC-like DNA-binding protein
MNAIESSVGPMVRLPGLTVQLVQYHWQERAIATTIVPDIVIRRRMWPRQVNLQAHIMEKTPSHVSRLSVQFPNENWVTIAEDDPGKATMVECWFDDPALHGKGGAFLQSNGAIGSSPNLMNPRIDYILGLIGNELHRPGEDGNELIDAWATALRIEFRRHLTHRHQQAAVDIPCNILVDPSNIRQLIRASDTIPRVSEIARHLGFSEAHLRRLYKRASGHTIQNEITDEKIRRACAFLLDTDLSLKIIAHRLGFGSHAAFTLAFTKVVGQSPNDYRRRAI